VGGKIPKKLTRGENTTKKVHVKSQLCGNWTSGGGTEGGAGKWSHSWGNQMEEGSQGKKFGMGGTFEKKKNEGEKTFHYKSPGIASIKKTTKKKHLEIRKGRAHEKP